MANRDLAVSLAQAGPIPLSVRFSCAAGEVLAIFGPSGSGKTTILRSIAGLYDPAEACVTVGADTWLDTAKAQRVPAHRRAVGFVFQEYALFPHMTARDNVAAALGHLPRADRRHRAEALLAQVHLSGQIARRPAQLSGGERQRVALARALAREPAVLLLDEPFAAVDRAVRRSLQDEVDQVRQSLQIPVVLVTHDFDDVVRLATHLVVLQDGRATAVGAVTDLTSRPELAGLRSAVGLGSVFDARVLDLDLVRGLARLEFNGGTLLAPSRSLTPGTDVRIRIPAREIILATDVPSGLSVHNVLAGEVSAVHEEPDSDHAVVQLAVGGVRLLAEVTRDATSRMAIAKGRRLHALIKSVSLEVKASLTQPRDDPGA